MSQQDLIVVVIVAVAFIIIYIADVFKYYAFRSAFGPVLAALYPQADRALAAYGKQLRPAHELFAAAYTLLDQDTDTLVQALPPAAVAQLRELLTTAQELTDGKVQTGEIVVNVDSQRADIAKVVRDELIDTFNMANGAVSPEEADTSSVAGQDRP